MVKIKTYFFIITMVLSLFLISCNLFSLIGNSNKTSNEQQEPIEIDSQVNTSTRESSPKVEITSTITILEPTSDPNAILQLPFEDKFDNGLRSEWRLLSGNPIIANGMLGSSRAKEVNLEIGNSRLINYEISTQLYGNNDNDWGGYFSELSFLLTPTLKVVIEGMDFDIRIYWFAFEDNEWEQILRSETSYDGENGDLLKVTVNGNKYAIFIDGQLESELIFGSVREVGSPLILTIYGDNIFLDYIAIK